MTERLCQAVRNATHRHAIKHPTPMSTHGVPSQVLYLWTWFWELDQTRQTGMSVQALTHVEIRAWAELSNERPRPWEVRALIAMDVERRTALAKTQDETQALPAITPDAFDNAFFGGED